MNGAGSTGLTAARRRAIVGRAVAVPATIGESLCDGNTWTGIKIPRLSTCARQPKDLMPLKEEEASGNNDDVVRLRS